MSASPVDPSRLCQIEIPVSDIDRASRFYAEAFGWPPVPAEMHEYVVLAVPDHCPFGISLVPQRGKPEVSEQELRAGPVVYFATRDPETVVARAVAAGGRRRFGPTRLFGYGVIFQVEDPDGNRFGLYAE